MRHEPYNKLKGFMRENGITVEDLANLLGLSPTTVSFKINGKSDFDLKELRLMIKHYGIDCQIFL